MPSRAHRSVHKGHNLSAIVRSADAFGVLDMDVVVGTGITGPIVPRPWVASVGSACIAIRPWKRLWRHEGRWYQVVVAHLDERSVDFREVDYTAGAARGGKTGQGTTALAAADVTVTIPMVGMVESFNVSVAAALLLSKPIGSGRQRDALRRRD